MHDADASTWLIGYGPMGRAHSEALRALGVAHLVITRTKNWIVTPGFDVDAMPNGPWQELPPPAKCIISVPIPNLHPVATELIEHGAKDLLLEKPGCMTSKDATTLSQQANRRGAIVHVAYNRRFFATVAALRSIAAGTVGPVDISIQFGERRGTLQPTTDGYIAARWIVANSSHVFDLVIHLLGYPEEAQHRRSGHLNWHPTGSSFSGRWRYADGSLMTFRESWESPGPWSLKMTGNFGVAMLQPLEALSIQLKDVGSQNLNPYQNYGLKPGLVGMLAAYLDSRFERFPDMADQSRLLRLLEDIEGT